MPYDMDDAGAYLQFTCSYQGHAWEKFNVVWGLFSLILFVTIVSSILFSPSAVFNIEALWTLGWFGLFLLAVFLYLVVECLWQFAGNEVMEIGQDGIVLRHQIFGIGISHRYSADKVEGVFVTRNRAKHAWLGYLFRTRPYGIVSFKYGRVAFNFGRYWLGGGPKTFRFGTSIEWDEAAQIVSIIHNRFPQYRYKQRHPVS